MPITSQRLPNTSVVQALRGCSIVALAWLIAAAWGHAGEIHVEVSAGNRAIRQAPVTLTLPAGLVGKAVTVRQRADGRSLPAQNDLVGGKPALTWIVPRLNAAESMTFVLSASPSAAPDSLAKSGVFLKPERMGADGMAEGDLDIRVDGAPLTIYRVNAGPKPYCWPIWGPDGVELTRNYPMKNVPGERTDHVHHRSFWFTHGSVNGENFWAEGPTMARTVHRKYTRVLSGPVFGEFVAVVDWVTASGKKICSDERRMRVYRVAEGKMFDFEIVVRADQGDLTFGDDKEGTFGFRVATTMDVDQPKGKPAGGTLVNSAGDVNAKAWGKRAEWCDYFGPVQGKTVGIAMFDHPANLRHPTYWHARTYGLFCANPFGLSFFTNKKENGTYKIPVGQELRLVYRILLHSGDPQTARVADHYAGFATPPRLSVKTQ